MYSIFFLCILSIILFIFLFKIFRKNLNVLISILLSFLILYLIIYPTKSIESSLVGGKIFITSIFPVMFPFMVCCNFLTYTDGIKLYSKIFGSCFSKIFNLSKTSSFAIITSYLCGYPLGTKYSVLLYEEKKIKKAEFIRLLNIANNAGPLFLIGSVGAVMLNDLRLGYLLLIPSYLSTIIIGLIFKKKEDLIEQITHTKSSKITYNIGQSLRKAIEDAAFTLIILAGYVILFSVIISIIKDSFIFNKFTITIASILGISNDLINSILLGCIELTNGCKLAAQSNLSIDLKLSIISFISSFGGLSIIAQTHSFFYKHNVSFKHYFSIKILQGLISGILMFLIYNLLNPINLNIKLILIAILFLTLLIASTTFISFFTKIFIKKSLW